jgi:hypothetical protein
MWRIRIHRVHSNNPGSSVYVIPTTVAATLLVVIASPTLHRTAGEYDTAMVVTDRKLNCSRYTIHRYRIRYSNPCWWNPDIRTQLPQISDSPTPDCTVMKKATVMIATCSDCIKDGRHLTTLCITRYSSICCCCDCCGLCR